MSWRIHTSEVPEVERTTVAELDEVRGYEHEEEEADVEILTFIDQGNLEMWVVMGDRYTWRKFAEQILEVLE